MQARNVAGALAFMSAYKAAKNKNADPLRVGPASAIRNMLLWFAAFLIPIGNLPQALMTNVRWPEFLWPVGGWVYDNATGFVFFLICVVWFLGLATCIRPLRQILPIKFWQQKLLPIRGDVIRASERRMLRKLREIVVPALVAEGKPFRASISSGNVDADHLTFDFHAAGASIGKAESALDQIRLASGFEFGKVTERYANGVAVLTFELAAEEPQDALGEARTFPVGTPADAKAALLGWRADGSDWVQRIYGRQVLIVGTSGAGKGSVIWSAVQSLAPLVAQGTHRFYGVDLKGGIELNVGRQVFTELATNYEQTVELLEMFAAKLEERLEHMLAVQSRDHVPTREQPGMTLILDEAASLNYLAPDAKSAKHVDALLKRILSTGRAAGINVIAALQDPNKEALTSRNLFMDVIGLRFTRKGDAITALGQEAVDDGAEAHRINTAQPGTAYVIDQEAGAAPVKVRAFWMSDAAIKALPPAPKEVTNAAH